MKFSERPFAVVSLLLLAVLLSLSIGTLNAREANQESNQRAAWSISRGHTRHDPSRRARNRGCGVAASDMFRTCSGASLFKERCVRMSL